ncbi:MAG TPA: PEP-utilizing enzyme, partial [bacterium]|nr:PEP-utilizing enzyme [bacterium]
APEKLWAALTAAADARRESAPAKSRKKTEKANTISDLMRGKTGQGIVPWDRALMKVLYENIKRYAGLREETRYRLFKGWSELRRLLLELARRPAYSEILKDPEDIFFLKYEELFSERGSKTGETASGRRAEFEELKNRPAGDILHISADGEEIETAVRTSDVEGVHRGIPASPGVVEGAAVRVSAPEDIGKIKQGDIAVVEVCSPWMSVLLGAAAGVVAESGGVVSHLALAAREYGRPMIVGARTLNGAALDGARLRVDASSGEITILEDTV